MEQDEQGWDIEVTAKRSSLSLSLSELWRYRDLLVLFVKRDFVAIYKQTVLGPVWFFLQPLLTALVMTVVFGRIAGLSTSGYPKLVFYLSGITCWGYFADCLTKTSSTFIANANVFSKVFFPRLIVPLAVIVSNLVRFSIQLLLLIVFIVYYNFSGLSIYPNAFLLLLPVLVILMAMLGLGAGLFVSALTTKYRDFQFLIGFGVTLLMYFSPVIFPLSMVESETLKTIIQINPMTSIIETFRYAVLGGHGPFEQWMGLAYTGAFAVVLVTIALFMFNKVQRSFMDTV